MHERFHLGFARLASDLSGSIHRCCVLVYSSIAAKMHKSLRYFQRRYLRVVAPRSTWAFIGMSFVAGIVLALVVGYFSGAEWAKAGLRAQWQAEITRQQSQLAEDTISWNLQLEMLAGKMAIFEARLARLDVLGTRLVDLYGLDQDEFDFFAVPGIGGSSHDDAGVGIDGLDAAASIGGLNSRIKARELQLSILKDIIGKGELVREMTPLGWPVSKGWISSRFGNRISPFNGHREFHQGVDIASSEGTPVYALASGIVVRVDEKLTAYGNMIEIDHGNDYSTRYAHNQTNLVFPGQSVRQGEVIALVGNTGRSTGAHLHFEVLKNGRQINPGKFLLSR